MNLLLGFASAAAFWPGMLGAVVSPRWAAIAVLIPLCLLLGNQKAGIPFKWPVLAIGLSMLPLAWSPDIYGGIDDLIHFQIMIAAFCLGSALKSLDDIWLGAAFGVAVSAVAAVAQMAGWQGVEQAVPPAGFFGNKNVLAEAGVVAFVIAVFARRWLLAAVVSLAVVLPLSWAAFGAVGLVATAYTMKRRPNIAMFMLAVIASFAVWALLERSSGMQRLQMWTMALSDFRLIGFGSGSYNAAFPFNEYAHNEFIQALYEYGLLCAPVFVAAAYAVLWKAEKYEREQLIVVAIAGVGFFSFPLHMPFTAFAAALACGHLVAARIRLRSKVDSSRDDLGLCL